MSDLQDISEKIGLLNGTVAGMRDLIIEHNNQADKHWDAIYAELRTIKHDQRNLEQKDIGRNEALKRIGGEVRALKPQIEKLDDRISATERLVNRAAGIAAAAASFGGMIGFVLTHYAKDLFQWAISKP